MRIATWNVERLKHKASLEEMRRLCEDSQADILVLTETDARLHPNYRSACHTPLLFEKQPDYYKPTENRVSIFTNYPCIASYTTYDARTALCVELETERGSLIVYGTIMGIYGNRHPNFKQDLSEQVKDFKRLADTGKPLCVVGDYNLSFCDKWYYTTFGRETVLQSFRENRLQLLTAKTAECIDHIAISEDFVRGNSIEIHEWNLEKSLSDHKGIVVRF